MRVHYLKVPATVVVLLSRELMVAYLQCCYSTASQIIIKYVSVAAAAMLVIFSSGHLSLNLLYLAMVVAAGFPVSVYYLLLDCDQTEMKVLCLAQHHFGCLLTLELHLEDLDQFPFKSMTSAIVAHYFLSVLPRGQLH